MLLEDPICLNDYDEMARVAAKTSTPTIAYQAAKANVDKTLGLEAAEQKRQTPPREIDR